MGKEQKVVYPVDLLRLEVDKVISSQMLRGDLWREINNEFRRKGLDLRSLQLLLDDDKKTASDLTDYELIAFSKIAYDKLKWKEINPKRYFGDLTLVNYENYFRTEKTIDFMKFVNFIKIDEFNFRGQVTLKDVYDCINSNMYIYDHESQRSPKYREVGSKNGKSQKLKVANINDKAVESISDAFLNKTFEDSEIVLNCEVIKGKREQQFKFIPKYEDVLGDIIIEPNYNMDSDTTTWVSVIDGYHRCKGIVLALTKHYEKTGEWLEGTIGVRLVRATKERAKRIVHQTFLRSSDNIEWVNALAEDDYTKFVDTIIKESKRLTIENTIEEAEINGKLTSKSILIDISKKINVSVNNKSEALLKAIDIADKFDLMYDYSVKKGIKLNPYKVGCYIYIGCEVEEASIIINIVDKLEDDETFIRMCRKNANINNLIKHLEEVIVNV